MLSSRMSRSELSSQGPAARKPRAGGQPGLVGEEDVGGDLLADEPGVGLVAVERLDEVVAVRPGVGPDAVLVVAVGLGEVDQVHPVPRHALAVVGRGEQAVDQPLVGVGPVVAEERLDLLGRRRQAGQVEREAADQGSGGRPRGPGSSPFARETGLDEGVDRVAVTARAPGTGGRPRGRSDHQSSGSVRRAAASGVAARVGCAQSRPSGGSRRRRRGAARLLGGIGETSPVRRDGLDRAGWRRGRRGRRPGRTCRRGAGRRGCRAAGRP